MKSLNTYINENFIDNGLINKFIDFLENNSEFGELKTNHKSYYDYFNECNPFDNSKFSMNINNTVYGEDYCEEHNIDSVEDDEENFIEYIKNIVDDQLTLELERGLIKIERVISLNESFSNYKGNIGVYWTYIEGMGDSHGAVSSSRNNITICGLVDPKDVNWEETIAANIIDPDEYELTLEEDAPIQITRILDVNRKEIFKENLLYKA